MLSSEIWSHPDRPLITHLLDVAEVGREIARSLPPVHRLDSSFPNLVWIGGMFHDYAKATLSFQTKLRGGKYNSLESRHSHLSSILAFQNIWDFLEIENDSNPESYLPLYAYLAVKRHHGNLDSAQNDLSITDSDITMFETQLDQIDSNFVKELGRHLKPLIKSPLVEPDEIKNELPSIRRRLSGFKRILRRKKSSIRDAIELSTYYSILIDADKMDASKTNLIGRESLPEDFVVKHIRSFGEPKSDINRLRTKAFYESLDFAESVNLEERILSLTLPTGLGKTYTGIAIAQKLRDRISEDEGHIPRIIYCLPFTSIIDQNHKEISDLLQSPHSTQLIKHHHLGDTLYSLGDDEESDYLKSELLIEGWNSEIVVTTFVQLFFTLAGFRNRPLRRMHNIAGAIVILDEVQAIPLKYWHLFNQLAKSFSDVLGTRFILVTATQPCIFDNPTEVVPHPDQYFSLTSRVDFNIQLEQLPFEDFKSTLLATLEETSDPDLLVILNTKRAAESLYNSIKEENPESQLEFLSTSVIPNERLKRIEKLRKKETSNRIVVSTQVVEAGVDIDFTEVYRDFAPLDSIVQAAGRCNRHMSDKRGLFSVRHLVDDQTQGPKRPFSRYIYDSMLLDATRFILERYEKINDTDLHRITRDYFEEIVQRHSAKNSRDILSQMAKLDYRSLSDVKLIEDKGFMMTDIFVEYNSDASNVLKKYEAVIDSKLGRFQKKAEFLKIRQDLMKYIISVYTKDLGAFQTVGSLAFIPNYDLERKYDLETGFKSSRDNALIL
ncbi:MAG: CRISPR-associated helicase Cas3' [Candidatus Thorarchaeota archaeon]|nr:CRISPR-associated helicase Cas3' [Candidatus Thorarchaeota archaeon]